MIRGECQARLEGCSGWANHRHHRKLRKQGGSDGPENLVDVCWSCHRKIHAEPLRSYELGLLVHSWEDPAEIPVLRAS